MCSSNSKLVQSNDATLPSTATSVSDINGRPVLQPNRRSNDTPLLERRSLKKTLSLPKSISMLPSPSPTTTKPPISPNLKSSPRQPAVKRDSITSNNIPLNKSKKCNNNNNVVTGDQELLHNNNNNNNNDNNDTVLVDSNSTSASSLTLKYSSASPPGSIAAARREQVAVMQVQRKMKIAHYGRSKSARFDNYNNNNHSCTKLTSTSTNVREDKRCSFITPNSDPIYVAYHDYEWGVPAHDDKLLFELLVLTGAQVGSDWTSVLKKRLQFREAFSGFDAEAVSKYTEKKIQSVSNEHGIDVSLVRGVVDNSKSIIEVKKAFGSFDNYIWGFVNHKPITTQYKTSQKIPVKTSKAESISKDMVKRGFRQVGPTVIHSFMQAAGLTNDHLTTCPRHIQCASVVSSSVSPNPLISVN